MKIRFVAHHVSIPYLGHNTHIPYRFPESQFITPSRNPHIPIRPHPETTISAVATKNNASTLAYPRKFT